MVMEDRISVGKEVDPENVKPQGDGSGLDADAVDGFEGHAPTKSAHDALGIDAATLDGYDTPLGAAALDYAAPLTSASGTLDIAEGSNIATDANGNLYVVQGGGSGLDADTVDGKEASALGGAMTEEASAYHSGSTNQSVSNSTWTQLTFDATKFDPGGNFDATNHQYVAPSGGVYYVTGGLEWNDNNMVDQTPLRIRIYVNGSGVRQNKATSSGANFEGQNTSAILSLSAGDTVSLYCKQGSGGSLEVINTSTNGILGYLEVGKVA